MKYLEIKKCKGRPWQTPLLTRRLWLELTAFIFIMGVVAGILIGSWYNALINNLAS